MQVLAAGLCSMRASAISSPHMTQYIRTRPLDWFERGVDGRALGLSSPLLGHAIALSCMASIRESRPTPVLI